MFKILMILMFFETVAMHESDLLTSYKVPLAKVEHDEYAHKMKSNEFAFKIEDNNHMLEQSIISSNETYKALLFVLITFSFFGILTWVGIELIYNFALSSSNVKS